MSTYYDVLESSQASKKVKHLIINDNTFRNVEQSQEISYLEKILASFKSSYPEAIIVFEKKGGLNDIEEYLKQFTQKNNMQLLTL